MSQKLSWKEIKERYQGQWVELVDYEWLEEEEYPRSGIVKTHSADRTEFYRLAAKESPVDSAIVFAGKHVFPKDQPFSPGIRRVLINHA